VEVLIPTMLLTPTLVLIVTLAGRRWGPVVGGRLAALPLTTGPLVLIAAFAGEAGVARTMAQGVLAGLPTVVVFCAGYRFLAARHSWPVSLLIAGGATVVSAGVLGLLSPPAWISAALVGLAAGGAILARRVPSAQPRIAVPAWELPLRMALSTGLVLTLSVLSRIADPRLAGVLATFPALACVLAPMAHRRGGAGAAIELVHGLLAGLPPTVLFFLALSVVGRV
jgi:hypothetical protein